MFEFDDGGSAFPSHGSMGEVVHAGMTLRDYFAAAALTGITSRGGIVAIETSVDAAYRYADAMLAARENNHV